MSIENNNNSTEPFDDVTSPSNPVVGIPFGYHIYDLSKGIAQRFGPSLTGKELKIGVLHAAIVIFGNEYFFEGNISKRPAGCTRFGKNFSFIPSPVPATAIKTEEEFEVWIRVQELFKYGSINYDLVENNCIHFCEAATKFLTGGKGDLNDEIKNNTAPLRDSQVGSLFMDFAKLMSNCGMLTGCELVKQRRICKTATFFVRKLMRKGGGGGGSGSSGDPAKAETNGKAAQKSNASISTAPTNGNDENDDDEDEALFESGESVSGVDPTRLHFFALSQEPSQLILGSFLIKLEDVIDSAFQDRSSERKPTRNRLQQLVFPSSSSSSSSAQTASLMTAVEASTLCTSLTQALASPATCSSFNDLGIILQLLVQFTAFHSNFCIAIGHDTAMRIMLRAVSDTFFCALPAGLKISVLELFCNILKNPASGCVFAKVSSFQAPLCFLISRGLLEPNSWPIVHRASCCLLNFVYAIIVLRHNAFEAEVMARGMQHNVVKVLAAGMYVANSVVPNFDMIENPQKYEENLKKFMQKNKEKENNNNNNNQSFSDDDASGFVTFTTPVKSSSTMIMIGAAKAGNPPQRSTNDNDEKKGDADRSSSAPHNDENLVKDTMEMIETLAARNPLHKITQVILGNVVESMLQFATSGRECSAVLVRHGMTPESAMLKAKCGTKKNFILVHDLSLIL